MSALEIIFAIAELIIAGIGLWLAKANHSKPSDNEVKMEHSSIHSSNIIQNNDRRTYNYDNSTKISNITNINLNKVQYKSSPDAAQYIFVILVGSIVFIIITYMLYSYRLYFQVASYISFIAVVIAFIVFGSDTLKMQNNVLQKFSNVFAFIYFAQLLVIRFFRIAAESLLNRYFALADDFVQSDTSNIVELVVSSLKDGTFSAVAYNAIPRFYTLTCYLIFVLSAFCFGYCRSNHT